MLVLPVIIISERIWMAFYCSTRKETLPIMLSKQSKLLFGVKMQIVNRGQLTTPICTYQMHSGLLIKLENDRFTF